MPVFKISAKRKFDSGAVKFAPGMSVTVELSSQGASSCWTGTPNRRAIAQAFVRQYGISCPVDKFMNQVNNVNFDYELISR